MLLDGDGGPHKDQPKWRAKEAPPSDRAESVILDRIFKATWIKAPRYSFVLRGFKGAVLGMMGIGFLHGAGLN